MCAVDGYSGKIVAFTTMPVKNCVVAYEQIYRYLTEYMIIIVCIDVHVCRISCQIDLNSNL